MMKTSKRFLSLILALILALGMLPGAMAAESDSAESIVEEIETNPETDFYFQEENELNTEVAETVSDGNDTENVEAEVDSDPDAESVEAVSGNGDPEDTEAEADSDPDAEGSAEASVPENTVLEVTAMEIQPELPRFVLDFPEDAEAEYTVGDSADEWVLAAEVSDGGTITYQWFTNEPDEYGELRIENLICVED